MENILSLNIVPWALPNESVPIGVIWQEKSKSDQVVLEFEDCFAVLEVLNGEVLSSNSIIDSSNKIVVFKPKVSKSREAIGYLGVVLKYEKIPKKNKTITKVIAKLIREGNVISVTLSSISIFRPTLKFEGFSSIRDKLGLNLIHNGFGDIVISIEGLFEGKVVTHHKDILKRALNNLKNNKERKKADSGEIHPDSKQKIKAILREMLDDEEIEEEDVDDLEQLYNMLQPHLIDIISELSNFQISPEARVKSDNVTFHRDLVQIENFQVRIGYRDLILNDYDKIIIDIPPEILRQIKKVDEIEIKVSKLQSNILQNVAQFGGKKN